MNYELAKKLKEAGFPQLFVEGRKAIVNKEKTEYCFEPTLSELIEACGEDFGNLGQYKFPSQNEDAWLATQQFQSGTATIKKGTGSTPEEAVANLWLKLQANEK